jgi:hypothetical protein
MGSVATIAGIGIANHLPIAEGGNDDPPLEEARANARLISRAPVLRDLMVRILEGDARDHAVHMAEARRLLDAIDGITEETDD